MEIDSICIGPPKPTVDHCECAEYSLLSGSKATLSGKDVNDIKLNLFTERNSDGSGYLVLRGRDLYEKYGKRIINSDIRAICRYVREQKRRITRLDLSYNEITDTGFSELLRKCLVLGKSSIINLNIMHNAITEISIKYLVQWAKYIRLRKLRLNGNKIGTNGLILYADFLRTNDWLECTDLGETDLTLKSLAYLITALDSIHGSNTKLKVLDLSRVIPLFNRFNCETKWLAYHIEFLLKYNTTIVELHLQKNEMFGQDMEYLTRGLKDNKTILYLDIAYNRFGVYGMEVLCKYFEGGSQLVFLNVAGNNILDDGARALSTGLPYTHIRALDIGHNNITDSGLIQLLNTLKKPVFMRFLNIWGNKFTHTSCLLLKRMFESGVLFQHTVDFRLYEVDDILYAAYYPNPADRNKHLYYCVQDYGFAQPIYHIKRNTIDQKKNVKMDCKHRMKLNKTSRVRF